LFPPDPRSDRRPDRRRRLPPPPRVRPLDRGNGSSGPRSRPRSPRVRPADVGYPRRQQFAGTTMAIQQWWKSIVPGPWL